MLKLGAKIGIDGDKLGATITGIIEILISPSSAGVCVSGAFS